MIDGWTNGIHQGDATETLRELPESSVHCVVTSPPYYGLRDYGDETITVWGGGECCEHKWEDRDVYQDSPVRRGNPGEHDTTAKEDRWRTTGRCERCGARREQLGLEEQLADYIEDLVDVGQAIRRVLREDGVWWLNLGDTFAGGGGIAGKPDDWDDLHDDSNYPENPPAKSSPLGRKNKMLVPHRVAIRLQSDGWIVRSDAIWAKPNPMPDPAKDRLREDKEYLFQLTPSEDYYFDLDAIREPYADDTLRESKYNWQGNGDKTGKKARRDAGVQNVGGPGMGSPEKGRDDLLHPTGKNPGDIFEVTVQPFPEAHFSVYPTELVNKPIKSSCPPEVCAECGKPHRREVEVLGREVAGGVSRVPEDERGYADRQGDSQNDREGLTQPTERRLGEWEPTCDCDTVDTEPGIVLDPFAGAGTTCLVAKRLGRRFIGIDLNREYVAMAQRRVGIDVEEPELLLDDDQPPLRAFSDGGTDD